MGIVRRGEAPGGNGRLGLPLTIGRVEALQPEGRCRDRSDRVAGAGCDRRRRRQQPRVHDANVAHMPHWRLLLVRRAAAEIKRQLTC